MEPAAVEQRVEQLLEQLKGVLVYLLTPSTAVFVAGGLVVLLVPILVHLFIERATPYASLPSVLLAGPSGAGKTALTTLLERGAAGAAPTRTSQAPQPVELTVSAAPAPAPAPAGDRDGAAAPPPPLSYREAARDDAPGSHRKFLLVDTPGHGKLRDHALRLIAASGNAKGGKGKAGKGQDKDREAAAANLRGIVFVVDAAALDDEGGLAAAADYLYDVLLALQRRAGSGRTSRAPRALHVLVAANKLDLFTALPASLVRSHLEAELGRVRRSRSKGLLGAGAGGDDGDYYSSSGAARGDGEEDEQDAWLGAYGTDRFAFAQMREFDVEVDVLGGSVLEGKVDKWWDWISERI